MAMLDPIDLAELRTDFDAQTATLTANKKLGAKDGERSLRLASLLAGAGILTRSIAWTPQADGVDQTLFLRVTDTVAGRVVKATLRVDDEDVAGNGRYLLDEEISVEITTINGTTQSSLDLRTITGRRFRELSGVRLRLDIENTTAATTIGGPLEAGVQVRSTRRGGAGGPALVPRALRNLGNFDVDALNANLLAIASDIEDSQDARYTYGVAFFDLSGVTQASVAALRQFAIRRPGASNAIEIVAVELAIPDGTDGITWTVTKSGDALWPGLEVESAGTLTTALEEVAQAYAVTNAPVGVSSAAADAVLEIAGSAAGTITRGYLVVHTRCDRWNQGTALTRFTPALYDATTSRDDATLEAHIAAIAARVAEDTGAAVDLRCECFVVRGLASGSSRTWRLPSGKRVILGTVAYIVGGVGTTATWTVAGTGLAGSSVAPVGTGAGNRVAATDAAAGTMNDDPTDSADDATVTAAITGGGTADLTYCLVFWQ